TRGRPMTPWCWWRAGWGSPGEPVAARDGGPVHGRVEGIPLRGWRGRVAARVRVRARRARRRAGGPGGGGGPPSGDGGDPGGHERRAAGRARGRGAVPRRGPLAVRDDAPG